LLGFYENFPVIPHAKASFTCPSPTKTLQEAIVCTLNRLNTQEIDLGTITHTTIADCKIGFEFGIAEGTTFNYLNPEEVEHFRKNLAKKEIVLNIDFLCVVKYHLSGSEKRQPLKFDHFLLRFIFRRPEVQLRVLHEKGTQHVSIEELIEFLTEQINTELAKMKAKPLKLGTIMHPVPLENL
jgi:hypothetical protein